ncbi:hypothetical protein PpBr36_07856 [Pyricularia pennisetigena]|uniref:hypothetical protein n=1 Tax=Pyricularia pennisetigena TaxID=1578925 RepID=UPI001150DB52|nr:hypothetical protein PpBr36_07856 [Pyricularia pennisetigena]TLS25998.1 hypothetical protein PpBr36_07856 [Pyricularia pennisetigena]
MPSYVKESVVKSWQLFQGVLITGSSQEDSKPGSYVSRVCDATQDILLRFAVYTPTNGEAANGTCFPGRNY